MRRASVLQIIAGFVVGAVLLSQLAYMDKLIIGINPLQPQGYFVSVLFGGSAGAIIAYLLRTEIAERKQAEEESRESEARLNSILSSMNDLVFVFDKEGRFTDCYSSADLYVSPEEFLGKKHTEVTFPYINKLFAWAFDKTRRGEVVEYKFWLDASGEEEWYLAKLSPMFREGKFAGAVSVMRNITQLRQAEEALQESEEFLWRVVDAEPLAPVLTGD